MYIFANETLQRLGFLPPFLFLSALVNFDIYIFLIYLLRVAISGNRCLTVREGMKLIQEDGSGGFDSHIPDEV